MLCFVVFLALAHAHAAINSLGVGQLRVEGIHPKLDHASSDKFGEDYPLDKRAVADEHHKSRFGHPYPAVQDSDDFDKDFVNDENSDGGAWDAQMRYDALRSKIQGAKEKMEKLKRKMEQDYESWTRAEQEASNLEDTLGKAKRDAEVARNAADAAAKRVNNLEGSSQNDGTEVGGAIGHAIGDVKKEMEDLQKCKEALARAKEKLKVLLKRRAEEKDAEEKKSKTEKAAKAKQLQQEKEQGHKNKKEKKEDEQSKSKKGKSKEATNEDAKNKDTREEDAREEEQVKREVEKDTKEASISRDKYQQELADVKRTEKELEEAAKTLKKFRRSPHVDNDGGVYNVPHKSLATLNAPVAFVSIALLGFFAGSF